MEVTGQCFEFPGNAIIPTDACSSLAHTLIAVSLTLSYSFLMGRVPPTAAELEASFRSPSIVAWTIGRIKMQFATRGLLLCVALASAVHPTPRDIIMSSLPMKNDDSGEHIDIDWFDRDLTGHLHRNIMEHETESRGACEHFHCAAPKGKGLDASGFNSYPMASVPSIDFPNHFAERDVIYVSKKPLFSAAECENVIRMAEEEGHGLPSTKSGKYQIGKAWIREMPGVLNWFGALSNHLFPTLSKLFPTSFPTPPSCARTLSRS